MMINDVDPFVHRKLVGETNVLPAYHYVSQKSNMP
jgi:hypothetical protein